MNNTKRLLTVFALLAWLTLGSTVVPAQSAAAGEDAPRTFDKEQLERYRNDPDYQYKRDKPEPPDRKPKKREQGHVEESYPTYEGPGWNFSGFAKAIVWVVIIGLAIFVLFQLLKVNWKGLARKKSDKTKVDAETEVPIEEDVTKMEFQDLLQSAVDAGNFRVAVRLLYLRTLRQLTDQGMIAWRREKTNHQYLREIKDPTLRAGFSDVTLIFEYIWYGEFPVNKDDYNLVRASFIQFEQSMRLNHAV